MSRDLYFQKCISINSHLPSSVEVYANTTLSGNVALLRNSLLNGNSKAWYKLRSFNFVFSPTNLTTGSPLSSG